MRKFITVVFCFGLTGLIPSAADQCPVTGDVSGTWSCDTMIVWGTGGVRVPPGETLVIEPGVKVFFQNYCKFLVDTGAVLRAVGTESDTIRFDEHWDFTGNGWKGIRFVYASDSSRLEYYHLTHGIAMGEGEDGTGGGVLCFQASPRIAHCLIDSCSSALGGGAIQCSYSNAHIEDNLFTQNSAGTYGGGAINCYLSSPSIISNTIIGNYSSSGGGGILCGVNNFPLISGNVISGNSCGESGGGICLGQQSDATIVGNTISGNWTGRYAGGGGIYCDASGPTISGNTINGNSSEGWNWGGGGICCNNNSNATINNNTVNGNWSDRGGGISCYSSSPTISGNTFTVNGAAWRGGGIHCENSSPTISDNILRGNRTENSGYSDNGGGGAHCNNSSPIIQNCLIDSCSSAHDGGGILCVNNSHPEIRNNAITRNTAVNAGGGIYTWEDSAPVSISGNRINRNTVVNYGGGGLYLQSTPDTFELNEITGNTCATNGGGIRAYAFNALMNKNTMADNHAGLNGGAIFCEASSPQLTNSVLWGNTAVTSAMIHLTGGSNADVTYSDLQTFWPGTGNIFDNPLFLNPESYDYHLQLGSPCVNSGDPDPQYNDPDGTRADMGCYCVCPDQAPARRGPLATELTLHANYPNPFNSTTEISFELPKPSHAILKVYDVLGREMTTLLNKPMQSGSHHVSFDASAFASGVYIYQLQTAYGNRVSKMVLLK